MSSVWRRIVDFFRRGPRHGDDVDVPRFEHNGRVARDRIRGATHPDFRDDRRRRTGHLVPGERRIGGVWAFRSPMHNNQWVGGYYISGSRRCYTVCNPQDPSDFSDETCRHEQAHDMEKQLRLVPPWHYVHWRRLFEDWRSLPTRAVALAGGPEISRKARDLPGVEPGDVVTVDYTGGQSFSCRVPE